MKLNYLTFLAGALLISSSVTHAQTGTGTTGMTSGSMTGQTSAFDRLFMLKAAQGNLAEVMTGQLAQQKSKNDEVRRLGALLVTEHRAANADLMRAMQSRGQVMPRFVGAMHMATYEQLQRANNRNFDALFLSAQVEAHENAINLYQQALQNATDPAARDYAQRYLPGIVGHTQQIYTLARRLNAPGMNERPQTLALPPGMENMAMMGNMSMGTGAGGMNGGNMNGMGNTGEMGSAGRSGNTGGGGNGGGSGNSGGGNATGNGAAQGQSAGNGTAGAGGGAGNGNNGTAGGGGGNG